MFNPKSLITGANIRFKDAASKTKWQDALGNISGILDDVSNFELPKVKTESEVKPSNQWYGIIAIALIGLYLIKKK